MEDEELGTKIDRFVDEVNKKGKMTFKEASKILNVPVEQVEQWAKLLNARKSETGIEIYYPTVGEPEIVTTLTKKKEEIKTKVTGLEEESKELADVLEASAKKAEEVAKKPLPSKDELYELTKRLEEKIGGLEKLEKSFEDLRNSVINVEGELRKTAEEEAELIKKAEIAKEELVKTKTDLEKLVGGLSEGVGAAETIMADLGQIKDARVKVPADIKQIEKDLEILEREMGELERRANTINVRKVKGNIRKILGGS